ncbi:MAG: type III secretion system inner membrane ring subunit SctD [Puniceicoccales bacterium]|jgi:type III secretion protein D|nr:type III secretion system inner membrane ring subunit SctD [Puniceicoccales bacterium]
MVAEGRQEEDEGVTSFLLRLISGPHAGAEMLLDEQDPRVIIGSGDGADVVLVDSLVEAEHAEIGLADGKPFIRSLGGRVFVDGKAIGDGAVDLLPFQFVTIGTSQIVGGPAGEEWPRLCAADAPRLEVVVEEVPDEVLPQMKSAGTDVKTVKAARQEAERVKKRRLLVRILLTVSMVSVWIVTTIVLRPEEKKLSLLEVEKILQAQITAMNFAPAVTAFLEEGRLVVDGYVPTNMELRELRSTVMATYPNAQLRVRSGEKIVESIEAVLHTVDARLRVVTLQPGVYSIAGYMYNADRWQQLRDRLVTDVPGVKQIRSDVFTPDRILALTAATLSQHALGSTISVVPEERKVRFSGKLSVLQLENWRRAAEEFVRTFGDSVVLDFDVQMMSAQTETANNSFFPSAIQSITISSGGLSWVATADGKRYFHGSFLPSGWRVDAIAVDGLRLSRDGRQVTMHLEALQ